MKSACDIFDQFRDASALTEDDRADFFIFTQDTQHVEDAAMAVSGLTLWLIEKEWNQKYFQWLLDAYNLYAKQLPDIVIERLIVGVLLVMMRYDRYIRENEKLLNAIQDVLTDAPELAYTALCNIARTSQIKRLEALNQQMTKELMPLMNKMGGEEFFDVIRKYQEDLDHVAKMQLDQNFLLFKSSYHSSFFTSRAANWLLPWNDEQLMNLPKEEREQMQDILDIWPMCDSDKYAMLSIAPSLRNSLRENLQVDMLHQVGDTLGISLIVTNGYVQQLYRYFRLSSFTNASPFELVPYMRDMLTYRLVVVGEKARQTINVLLK